MIDPVAFKRDYYDQKLTAAEVAGRYGLTTTSLSQAAREQGLATRKELGIRAKRRRSPRDASLPGATGCNPSCRCWAACNVHKGREILPCEVLTYLDENPAVLDNEPAHHPAIPFDIIAHLVEQI